MWYKIYSKTTIIIAVKNNGKKWSSSSAKLSCIELGKVSETEILIVNNYFSDTVIKAIISRRQYSVLVPIVFPLKQSMYDHIHSFQFKILSIHEKYIICFYFWAKLGPQLRYKCYDNNSEKNTRICIYTSICFWSCCVSVFVSP